jgi:predicted DNA-binding protein with PD1-like motif
MPYIKKEDRPKFEEDAKNIAMKAKCAGDLNYAITVILHSYLKRNGVKYANVNELIGMMECCKMELYRKIGAPYEDLKITQNGDVEVLSQEDIMGKQY